MARVWKLHGFVAAALLLHLTVGAALAQDVYVEQKVEMSAMGGQPPTQMLVKIWFTPDKMRIDQPLGGGTTVIMRTDQDKMYILNQAAKTYVDQSLEAAKSSAAAAATMMGGEKMQVEVKPTGTEKKIGEWNCKQYLLTVTGGVPITMEIWTTTDLKIDPNLYSKMSDAMGANPLMTPLTEKIKSIPGYPVQTVMKMPLGGQVVETTSTVQKISQDTIAPTEFNIPEGYTKMEAPAAAPAPAAPGAPAAPAPKKGGS
jgi:hypothetical protein